MNKRGCGRTVTDFCKDWQGLSEQQYQNNLKEFNLIGKGNKMVTELGHLVLYVRDLTKMVEFYRDIVGLSVVGTIFDGRAAALTGGRTHHELLLIEVGDAPGPLRGHRIGLYHTGWHIGDDDDILRAAKQKCLDGGVSIVGLSDHGISHSLYVLDPDGNEVELYIDVQSFNWKDDPSWMEYPVRPLDL